jgi:hypothetical protein
MSVFLCPLVLCTEINSMMKILVGPQREYLQDQLVEMGEVGLF